MTNEELVQKIQDGQTELTSELWFQVEKFVRQQAYKFSNVTWYDKCKSVGVEQDDLYQVSYFALEPAIKAFKADAGSSFINYFAYYLKTAFYKEIRVKRSNEKWYDRSDALSRSTSLEAEIYTSASGDSVSLEERIADESAEQALDDIENDDYIKSLRSDLEEAISSLRPREAQIIRDHYFNDLSIEAQAHRFSVSRTTVTTLRQQALIKLRKHKALEEYREELISRLSYKTSFGGFKEFGMSAQESIVIKLDEYERRLGLK